MENSNQRVLYLVPSFIVFLMALMVTFRHPWPVGWDIFYHIHLAKVYMLKGLTFFDPVYNAPEGAIINYPPVFHMTLLALAYLFRMNMFDVARIIQPFLACLVALSVTLVASRFYEDKIVGLAAGLILFSGAIAMRLVSPLPENMALIFLPLSIYFYYEFFKEDKLLSSFISGVLMGIVALIHPAATFCLGFAITFITAGIIITELYFKRDVGIIKKALKGYGILIMTAGLIAAVWWAPAFYLKSTGGPGGVSTSLQTSRNLSIMKYPDLLGYLVIVLSLVGLTPSIKRFGLRDRFILLWVISMFLLSKAYYFGVNVITYRVLIYIMIPMSILAAHGLRYTAEIIETKNKNIACILMAAVLLFAVFQGFSNLSSTEVVDYGAMTSHGRIKIAPPTPSEVELAEWFSQQDKGGTISMSNYFAAGFIMAYTNRPVNPLLYEKPEIPQRNELTKNGIVFLVFDKRLRANGNFTFDASSSFLFYNPSKVDVSSLKYPYLEKVYENSDFVVYRVV
ncbi:hypothetical protein FVF72_08300 [Methanothermobacter sp. KEPCO-1]|uniref:hypothetical protein n=1 Tax=Methanothermobacter sp. KEPCO-1 TaxID=2603820 RepID=UPI0011C77FAD|nr:hypothetical protein [Methanothermobacter sp. KEPCO-1]QEF95146.1 hypothetical protein FVF72_08300 [Methanothermobacter sp. KEPCO-1]